MALHKISLCMIVKNEEKYLEKCLNSVVDKVDEIIIVDTGSSDKTKEIAYNFTQDVFDFEWNHDFSAARNYALSKTTNDWILQLDADEYLVSEQDSLIRDVINSNKSKAYLIDIRNYMSEGSPILHRATRLFKKDSNVKYHYKIHEQPFKNGKPFQYLEPSNIVVNHVGYTKEVSLEKNKRKRNMDMLLESLKGNEDDSYLNFNIGNEYLSIEEYDNAIEHYRRSLNSNPDMYHHIVLRLVMSYIKTDELFEAEEEIQKAKKKYKDYTDLYLFHGKLLVEQGRLQEAEEEFLHCLKLGKPNKAYLSHDGVSNVLPLIQLAKIYSQTRNYEKLTDTFIQLVNFNKTRDEATQPLFKMLKKNLGKEEVYKVIDEFYKNDKEVEFSYKVKLYHDLRLEEEFVQNYPFVKQHFEGDLAHQYDFYYHLYNKQYDVSKEIIKDLSAPLKELYSLVYFVITGDSSISDLLSSDTSSYLFNHLNKNNLNANPTTLSSDFYLSFLKELERLGEFNTFEKVLELNSLFDDGLFKEIGEIFYNGYNDELAIDFFAVHMEKNPDDYNVILVLTNLLYNLGYLEDAMVCAEKALDLNQEYFRPLEILLQSKASQGKKDEITQIALLNKMFFPKSKLLNQYI